MKDKWWLINDEDVKTIKIALIESNQTSALHTLDSGLHLTNEIPDDFKEGER